MSQQQSRFKVVVEGDPEGKGRPRFSKVGKFVHVHTPKKTANYEKMIAEEYIEQTKGFKFSENALIDLKVIAYFRIPKSASKRAREQMRSADIRPNKKPDADNILKIVCDALNDVAYRDDKQVVDTQLRKYYSDNPGLVIYISEARHM